MSDKPWLSHYDNNVLTHIQYPNLPIQEFLFNSADRFPGHVCLRFGVEEYTYHEVRELVLRAAASLLQLGIHPGDRVGLILPNLPEFVIAYYASLLAGAVVVPLNPAYTLNELTEQVKKTNIRCIFGWEPKRQLLLDLKHFGAIETLVLYRCDRANLMDSLAGKPHHRADNKGSGVLDFADFLSISTEIGPFPALTGEHPALYQFSGGTTGTPKAAVALHKNVGANVHQFRHWLASLEDGQEEWLTVIPLSHVYGMVIGLNVGIAMGATINLLPDPRDARAILDTIQERKITFFPGVPTMYHAINQNEEVRAGRYDLHTIKSCISGSAPLLPEIRSQFEALTGGKLVEGYGLSEAPTATHCNPIQGENRNGSIGLPLPDVDSRIENFTDLPAGTGELLISGPQVMTGYLDDDAETANALKNGWLHTGDIARMDSEGYFYLVGRMKELIKVGGLQVWPQEVESAILKNKSVKEVVVAGIPDLARGECVKAWVVVREGAVEDEEAIKRTCTNEIAYFKVPREIEFIEEIPRTSVGKVLRRELVKREMEKEDRE